MKEIISYISFKNQSVEKEQLQVQNAGYLIGILERIIIATLVLQNQISAIGFILAAKSLARFKQLEDKDFAEKYLVGTLVSVTIALVITIMVRL